MPVSVNTVYNSLWQVRGDSWSSLEESTTQLALASAQQRPVEQLAETVKGLLEVLSPIERYWAFPGPRTIHEVQRLFAAGKYGRLAALVSRVNRALVTESYRNGRAWDPWAEDDAYDRESPQGKSPQADRPYFEVLIVEDMTEEQENSLREELRRWRRPDDQFVYEIVVVPSFEDALMATRLNIRLQACVVRRRFAHRSRHESPSLRQFASIIGSDDLMEHSPDDRPQVLARALARIRPELDLYLMTEISVEDLAGAQPSFPAYLPRPGRIARAASVHPGWRRGPLPGAVLQRAAQLQPPADRRVPRAADLARQVDPELALDPSRITIAIGATGIEGDVFKRRYLMDRYGVQINKTSRNTVLFMTTIGTTRSSVAYLIEVLVTIARDLEAQIADSSPAERAAHERAVLRLTAPSAPLPDFSGFHPSFADSLGSTTPEGDVRRAFYLGYNDSFCEYLTQDQVEQRMEMDEQVVSATYVTPYPPGYPVLVPGQVFSLADPVVHARPGYSRGARVPA